MSLSKLANLCSHLNNVNKARLSIASVPNTKLHLKIFLAFLNQGLISSVVLGGPSPPPSHLLLGHPTPEDRSKVIVKFDKASNTVQKVLGTEPVTQCNVASRKLWIGLKYWNNKPVLGKLTMVSKPKRKINLDTPGLRSVLRGDRRDMVQGIRSPGESLFMLTNLGLMESRQCLERQVGGLALFRME